jgi:hypothetical protein
MALLGEGKSGAGCSSNQGDSFGPYSTADGYSLLRTLTIDPIRFTLDG